MKSIDSTTVNVLVEGGQINVFVAFSPDVVIEDKTHHKPIVNLSNPQVVQLNVTVC